MGIIFPIKQITKLLTALRPSKEAAIKPPRSSNIGIKEIIKTINSFPNFKLVNPLKASTNVCAKFPAIISLL